MAQKRNRNFWLSISLIFCCIGLAFAHCWADSRFNIQSVSIKNLPIETQSVVLAANQQVGKTIYYDPAYKALSYPNGDVPISRGVCTDVVIRALRAAKYDLQLKVHEDMEKRFREYPNNWGLKKPDSNIDHRRVPNLDVYFKKVGWSLPVSKNKKDYQPGDIVAWKLFNGRDHIGLVTNKTTAMGTPMIVHNIGLGAQIENVLFSWKITGHYRPKLKKGLESNQSLLK